MIFSVTFRASVVLNLYLFFFFFGYSNVFSFCKTQLYKCSALFVPFLCIVNIFSTNLRINTIIKVLFLARLMFSFCFVLAHLCDVPVMTDIAAVSGLGDVCSVNRTVHGLHTLRRIHWLNCSQEVFALQSVHVLVCAFCRLTFPQFPVWFCKVFKPVFAKLQSSCKRHWQPCTELLNLH